MCNVYAMHMYDMYVCICSLGAHPLAARGVAVVRGLVRQRLARQREDDRPVQQPAHQGAQARPGAEARGGALAGARQTTHDSRVEDLMTKAAKDVGASTAAKDEL